MLGLAFAVLNVSHTVCCLHRKQSAQVLTHVLVMDCSIGEFINQSHIWW